MFASQNDRHLLQSITAVGTVYGKCHKTVGCPSVRPSVPSTDSGSGGRRLCCRGWARVRSTCNNHTSVIRMRMIRAVGNAAPNSVYVTVRCPSVRLPVPSIDSSSDVQLVCRSPGAGGGRYRSISSAPELSSGQRQCCDPRRIDADLLTEELSSVNSLATVSTFSGRSCLEGFGTAGGRLGWQPPHASGVDCIGGNEHCAIMRRTTDTTEDAHCVCSRAYSKRVPRTNCALRIKKCAPRISSGIYFLSTC